MKTCKDKKSDPNTPSLIEKGAILYSYACTKVNTTPYATVAKIPLMVAARSPDNIAL